jgi:AraC-like DNA-binding protein
MLKNRHELIEKFKFPLYIPHPFFPHLNTFNCTNQWKGDISVELPSLRLILHHLDYLISPSGQPFEETQPVQFQQNTYRLWYQIDGSGILQNATKKTFGTARPGLLGVMDRGERHTYMHQRGHFSSFQMLFSLLPSLQAKCYWNSEIEGKIVLDETEKLLFENRIFTMFLLLSENREPSGLMVLPKLLEIIITLFDKGLIVIEEERFPKNKSKCLVTKAKSYMNLNYAKLHHQDNLEKECGVDINYLNILFKKETGRTLYHYLSGVRMEHAKHLLATTPSTIADIAAQTGYPNANSFARAFKRFECLTPKDFRGKQLNNNNRK